MSHFEDFIGGWTPDTLELDGDWIVKGLVGPFSFRVLGHMKSFAKNAGEFTFAGNNTFLGSLKTGYYSASLGTSKLDPSLDVINIDYATPKNPWIMRGLTDEVRFVSENKLLGRGVYQPEGFSSVGPHNIFWFTVEKM